MNIIGLEVENFAKIKAVSIKPDGSLNIIAGKNGAGKTSLLNAISAAIEGAAHIHAEPIRKGQKDARIRLDLGDVIVTRTFAKREDGDTTTSLKVTAADGSAFKKPQDILNSLFGALAFDPQGFMRMRPKEQLDALKKLAPGVDFAAMEQEYKKVFAQRTEINRQAESAKARAAGIPIPTVVPKARVDESALIAKLTEASEHNSKVDAAIAVRDRVGVELVSMRERATALAAELEQLRQKIEERQGYFDRLPEAGEKIDARAVQADLEAARANNATFDRMQQREAALQEAAEKQKEADALSNRLEDLNQEKHALIAAAKLPVEGLDFGAEEIMFNGVPFEQASSGEQLRVAVAIAAALNPRLKVIILRDASLLDDEAMKYLAEFAASKKYQVFAERVGTSGDLGFEIEDGQIVRAPAQQAAE